jgi:hypothetical protein
MHTGVMAIGLGQFTLQGWARVQTPREARTRCGVLNTRQQDVLDRNRVQLQRT